jgi:ABC-2 type transport system ATP-binding protein
MGPELSGAGAGTRPPPAIVIDHLTKRLRNGITAVDDVSLTVEAGEVLGLVGPNGSGKTITMKVLLGLVRPTSGSTSIFGETMRPGAPVLGRVGALVDGPGFVPYLSGRRNLSLAVRQIRLTGGTPDLDAAVTASGLGAGIDRPVSDYSHGMRYRLALAQALLARPDLLILDEPTTGMDPAQVLEVRESIRARAAEGTTVVLSSHQLTEIEEICTHAAVLRAGRLIASGAMDDLIGGHPRIRLTVTRAEQADLAVSLLSSRSDVSAVNRTGAATVELEGDALRPVELVDTLDGAGITVAGFRGTTFEDSYLALFEVGAGDPAGPAGPAESAGPVTPVT